MLNPPAGGGLSPKQKGFASGLSWKEFTNLVLNTNIPPYFLQNKISKDEMLSKMLVENWQYAKRQMTWFKRDKRIKWTNSPTLSSVSRFLPSIFDFFSLFFRFLLIKFSETVFVSFFIFFAGCLFSIFRQNIF